MWCYCFKSEVFFSQTNWWHTWTATDFLKLFIMGMHYICLSNAWANKCNNNTSTIYLIVILILHFHLCPGLQSGLLPANFLTTTLHALSSLLCIMLSALLFPSYFIWTLLDTMYKLWCHSSCTFLQSPVVSSPLAAPGDFMLLVRCCHFVSDKRAFSMLFNDTVKCQDYTALDSVVREILLSVDMFQCIEMGDVLKILCETWKKSLQNFES